MRTSMPVHTSFVTIHSLSRREHPLANIAGVRPVTLNVPLCFPMTFGVMNSSPPLRRDVIATLVRAVVTWWVARWVIVHLKPIPARLRRPLRLDEIRPLAYRNRFLATPIPIALIITNVLFINLFALPNAINSS